MHWYRLVEVTALQVPDMLYFVQTQHAAAHAMRTTPAPGLARAGEVEAVMSAVLLLLTPVPPGRVHELDVSWGAARRVVTSPDKFLQQLVEFKDQVDARTVRGCLTHLRCCGFACTMRWLQH